MSAMTCEEFEYYINELRSKYEKLDNISEVLRWDDAYELSMGDRVVDLLAYIFDDHSGWINCWVYEKNFGRDWCAGCIKNKDGADVDLSTPFRLYNFLVENMSR